MDKMTIRELSSLFGKQWDGEDKVITSICTFPTEIAPNCALFIFKNDRQGMLNHIKHAINQGASVIISETQIDNYPCIVVDDAQNSFHQLGRYYKNKYKVHTVGVTGSIGKTTCKEIIYSVLSEHYNTLKTGGSANSPYAASKIMLNITPETEAVVLEMGMSQKNVISRISQNVEPDIAVITNIGFSHIQYLKSREGILQAKLEITKGMSNDGYVLLNKDDERLSKVDSIEQKIIYFSIKDNTADYFAENIVSEEFGVSFDIVRDGGRVKSTLNCFGEHNVYNALAAYIVGTLLEVPEDKILEGISNYQTSGVRQNVSTYDDIVVIADCYNAAPDSIETAVRMLCSLQKNPHGRNIAVLADMLELGDLSVELHHGVGKMVNRHDLDLVVCYGVHSQYIVSEIDNPKTVAVFFREKEALLDFLSNNIRPYDKILFKGSNKMNLGEVITKIFESGNKRESMLQMTSVRRGCNEESRLRLYSKNALLANLKTGEILFEKEADSAVFPAGTTKIITGAIALEMGDCDSIAKVEKSALSSSVISTTTVNKLIENEEIKLGDLVILLMLSVGNDAANVIAEHLFGDRKKAVEYANAWARERGMSNSNFINLHGLHHNEHYTTAKDMFIATQYAMNIQNFRKIVRLDKFKITPLNGNGDEVLTKNLMLDKNFENTYYYPDCIGVKTGITKIAGYCSVEVAARGDVELCALCFGAPVIDDTITAYLDAKNMFEFGFGLFK